MSQVKKEPSDFALNGALSLECFRKARFVKGTTNELWISAASPELPWAF